MSSNTTTYYVDINSQYRDVEKYPNPTDFAISFSTNTQTGYFPQGLPLNSNSYFEQVRIDPDFLDADITFINIRPFQYERVGNSIFVCGRTNNSSYTGCYVKYGDTNIFELNIPEYGNPDVLYIYTFLLRIDIVDAIIPYKVIWNIFDKPTGNYLTYLGSSNVKNYFGITQDNNIYMHFTTNGQFQLEKQDENNILSSLTEEITPPLGDNTQIYPFVSYIFLLDFDGNLGLYNGHNWGYHAFTSEYNDFYSNTKPIIDTGKNLYLNLDSITSFNDGLYLVDSGFEGGGYADNNLLPRGLYLYSGIPDNPLAIFNQWVGFYVADPSEGTGAFYIMNNSFTGCSLLSKQYQPRPIGVSRIGYCDFCETSTDLYGVQNFYTSYQNTTGGILYSDLPLQYYKLNKTGLYFDYVATTPVGSYNGFMYPHSVSFTNNNVYTFGRASFTGTDNTSLVYAYKLDTTTNIVSKVATISLTGSNQSNSKVFAVVKGSYIYVLCNDYDNFNSTNDDITNGYVLRFDPTTDTLIIYSTYSALSSSTAYQTLLDKDGLLYVVTTYNANPDTDFYDINDFSNVTVPYAFPYSPGGKPILVKYTKQSPTNYFIFIFFPETLTTSYFNINDLNNIYQQIPSLFAYNEIGIDNEGNTYNLTNLLISDGNIRTVPQNLTNGMVGSFAGKHNVFSPSLLQSIHYNQNISSSITVPTGTNCMATYDFPYNNTKVVVIAAKDWVQFYYATSTIALSLVFNAYAPQIFSTPNVMKTITFGNGQYIFIAVGNQCIVIDEGLYQPITFGIYATITSFSTITDLVPYVKNNKIHLILCDINSTLSFYVYEFGSFNLLTTQNFASGLYNRYGCSFYFENLGTNYLTLLLNRNPISNLYYIILLDISNVPFINVLQQGTSTSSAGPAATSYKSVQNIQFFTVNQFLMYFGSSDIEITSGVGVFSTDSILANARGSKYGQFIVNDYNIQRCIAAFVFNNKEYIVCNRSNPGDSSEYLACYISEAPSAFAFSYQNVFYYTVVLPAPCRDLKIVQVGTRAFAMCLLDDDTIYSYDLTDPSFAGQNQNQTIENKTFSDPKFISYVATEGTTPNYIVKINNDGSTQYATYLGPTSDQLVNVGFNKVSNSLIFDTNQQNIYLSANFSASTQYFNYTSTGYYKSQYILNNKYNRDVTSVIQKININNGNSIWMLPYIGEQSVQIDKICICPTDNTIIVTGFSNSSVYGIYQIQNAGNLITPTLVQKNSNTTSLSSGFLSKITQNGVLSWNNTLYTNNTARTVECFEVSSSSDKIITFGRSTANQMETIDSTNTISQTLYSNINSATENNIFFFVYDTNGKYLQSNLTTVSRNSGLILSCFYSNKDENEIVLFNRVVFTDFPAIMNFYNKDGTYAGQKYYGDDGGLSCGTIVRYKYDSSYYDVNGLPYSQIVYKTNPSYTFTGSDFENYYIYIGGSPSSTPINKSFSIRDNFTGPYNKPTIILNTQIDISQLDRTFQSINNIVDSQLYYFSNLSKSPLSSIIQYDIPSINPPLNQLKIIETLTPINPSQTYYVVYPYMNGIASKVVPVSNIQPLPNNEYIFTLQYLDDLRSPTGGRYYGPWLYLAQFNSSLYYNLQFFPGSIAQPVYYNVRLQSMTVPNRPLLNLEEYGGNMNFNDLPFMYLSIYNVDDNDNYDDQIVNVVYDSTPLNVKPYPIFQIPITNPGTLNNFVTLSSDIQPVVKFTPGYYNIRVRLLDMNGDPILLDQSNTKASDSKFIGGSLPSYMTSVYLRLAFTKRG